MNTTTDIHLAALIGHGARIVPVTARDKRPIGAGWQHRATSDMDTIAEWVARHNVGICLGHGRLIDVEFDDHAAYEAFMAMETADGQPLHEITTVAWESARGVHHLFRLADPLPPAAVKKLRSGVEVRLGGKAAQSVLPPSVHPSGFRYRWIASPADVAPAAITLADLGLATAFPMLAAS